MHGAGSLVERCESTYRMEKVKVEGFGTKSCELNHFFFVSKADFSAHRSVNPAIFALSTQIHRSFPMQSTPTGHPALRMRKASDLGAFYGISRSSLNFKGGVHLSPKPEPPLQPPPHVPLQRLLAVEESGLGVEGLRQGWKADI